MSATISTRCWRSRAAAGSWGHLFGRPDQSIRLLVRAGDFGLLVGGMAAVFLFGGLGLTWPSNMLFLAYAAFVAVLSRWREGAYAMDRAGPRLAAVVIGWVNASGMLALTMCALDALSTSAAREGALDPESLTAFVVAGGAAVLGRNVVVLVNRLKTETCNGRQGRFLVTTEDALAPPQLSPREKSILRCLIEGDSNK